MEAPKKIYIDANEDWHRTYTAFSEKAKGDDIKYTRTDAFIEKACDWLESVNLDFYQIREGVFSRQLVEDFKKYMEEL